MFDRSAWDGQKSFTLVFDSQHTYHQTRDLEIIYIFSYVLIGTKSFADSDIAVGRGCGEWVTWVLARACVIGGGEQKAQEREVRNKQIHCL